MEDFKPRTKITLIFNKSKIIFSGNKRDVQIAILPCGTEVRANKLSTAFRFKAIGFRPVEATFDEIRDLNFKILMIER